MHENRTERDSGNKVDRVAAPSRGPSSSAGDFRTVRSRFVHREQNFSLPLCDWGELCSPPPLFA